MAWGVGAAFPSVKRVAVYFRRDGTLPEFRHSGTLFSVIFEPSETMKTVSFTIIVAGAAQGVFLGMLFLVRAIGKKKDRRMPDALLAALMFAFSVNIFHAAIIRPLLVSRGFTYASLEPFQLLFGPLLYGYVRSLVSPASPRFRLRPAVVTLSAFLLIAACVTVAGIYTPFAGSARRAFDACAWVAALGYLFHYLAKTLRMVHRHQRIVRDEFADDRGVDLAWVRLFIFVFILVESAWALLLVWIIHENLSPHFGYVNAFVSSLVVYALGFRALLQRPDVTLSEISGDGDRDGDRDQAAGKYGRSSLGDGELAALKTRLLGAMADKRPWLNSELNLQDLAECAGMSRHTLTEVLNRSCGMNFYDYVNAWRVDEFKRRVILPESDRMTLLAVALDSGFNSKGTFNAVFRKSTGMTPSAWRNANRRG